MDLAKHFAAYRESLRKDALDGFDDYAATIPTAKPDVYPKTIDYLKHAFSSCLSAVRNNHEPAYREWLPRHQGAMIALFDRMVEDDMWDYKNTTAASLMALITDRGWNWFKFCRKSLELTLRVGLLGMPEAPLKVVFIPRYSEDFKGLWSATGQVVFDADEGRFVFGEKLGPDFSHPIMNHKLWNPGYKLVSGEPRYTAIASLNTPEAVVDWSLPLF